MRLIDADALMEKEHSLLGEGEVLHRIPPSHVDAAPTIEAVPVVRCRECKHFNLQTHECENEDISTDHEGGASYSLNFYDDDFCSYGERKEDGNEYRPDKPSR